MSHRDPPIQWPRTVLVGGVAIALAFGLGWQLARSGRSRANTAATSTQLEARLAALDDALTAERAARVELEQELEALRARTEGFAARLPAGEPAREPGGGEVPSPENTPPVGAEAEAETTATLFDVEALVAGCMDRRDAERLRTRWERYQLDRLELNDRARREGFFMTPIHREGHAALDAAFRSDVGDDGYDAYLRATGRPNRVAVKALLPTGAGRAAGLEVGDELEEYAGSRVYSPADLQLLTASGRLGELISIEVLRAGQPLTLRVARGPLGIVLDAVRRAPEGGC